MPRIFVAPASISREFLKNSGGPNDLKAPASSDRGWKQGLLEAKLSVLL
jgi:hypothetical protein